MPWKARIRKSAIMWPSPPISWQDSKESSHTVGSITFYARIPDQIHYNSVFHVQEGWIRFFLKKHVSPFHWSIDKCCWRCGLRNGLSSTWSSGSVFWWVGIGIFKKLNCYKTCTNTIICPRPHKKTTQLRNRKKNLFSVVRNVNWNSQEVRNPSRENSWRTSIKTTR